MIDWAAFQDETMPAAEREALEKRLAEDEALRAEYSGYQKFQTAIREAHSLERVPHARLETMLSTVAAPESAPTPYRRWAPRLAVAFALGVVLYLGVRPSTRDPLEMNVTPMAEMARVDQPQIAANWVNERTDLRAPVITLAGAQAQFDCTRVGTESRWACYDYIVNGKKIYLYISRFDNFERGIKCRTCDGTQLYRGKSGVGWRFGDLAYYIRGADQDTLRNIAEVAIRELKAGQRVP